MKAKPSALNMAFAIAKCVVTENSVVSSILPSEQSISCEAPNIVQANVEFEALEVEIPIAVDPIARCSISINGEGFNVGYLTLSTPDLIAS